jgi:hypothetical protein
MPCVGVPSLNKEVSCVFILNKNGVLQQGFRGVGIKYFPPVNVESAEKAAILITKFLGR